ncbi:CocE/NonD family hydrolase C-terminal non-catalytic domain-containing protein [Kitasatospora sp. DSM 101779]|uniref:CocE/NonD family hydrolase C-terminal non-catalytic domain-containing protein n=1 Tax=Kitasatospora sp. DSM 101779 TaxID=2853165 RepID=UPI0021D81B86|nr:CocE/NonD family hydrolase C-terminal non-catalytic domain-containing protein [Kitasatospora sp. DSM 101779]
MTRSAPAAHAPYAFLDRTPGRRFTADVRMQGTAYGVPAGHRLALVVDGVDPLCITDNPAFATLTFGSTADDPSWVAVPLKEGNPKGRGELRNPKVGIVTNAGPALVRTASPIRTAQFRPPAFSREVPPRASGGPPCGVSSKAIGNPEGRGELRNSDVDRRANPGSAQVTTVPAPGLRSSAPSLRPGGAPAPLDQHPTAL